MREILFRGEHPKAGWVYGAYICHETRQLCPIGSDKLKPDEVKHYIARDGFADWNMPRNIELVPINPETVGQYTGLTDKNGKKIFEGDVLKLQYEEDNGNSGNSGNSVKFYGYVGYFDGYWGFVEKDYSPDILDSDIANQAEVVGNIHDNPELLEVENG